MLIKWCDKCRIINNKTEGRGEHANCLLTHKKKNLDLETTQWFVTNQYSNSFNKIGGGGWGYKSKIKKKDKIRSSHVRHATVGITGSQGSGIKHSTGMWPSVWKMDKRFKIIPVKVTRCFPSGGEPVSRSGMWECGQVWCKHHHILITCWHRGQSWSLPLRSKLRSPLQGRTFPQRAARKTAHNGSNNHEQASCALACPKSQRRLRAPSASSIACRRRCWCHFNRCDLFIQYNTF